MKKATPGKKLDSNLEMMPIWKSCPSFIEVLHYMPRSKNKSGVYRPKYKKKRTSRLSRSASVRAFILWRAVVAGNVNWPMPCMPRLTPLAAGALRCSGSRTGRANNLASSRLESWALDDSSVEWKFNLLDKKEETIAKKFKSCWQKNQMCRKQLKGQETGNNSVVVLTLTRIFKSVVTGQAPVTLELRNTPVTKHIQPKVVHA